MRYFLIVFCLIGRFAMAQDAARLQEATFWLQDLGVNYAGPIDKAHVGELRAALKAWRETATADRAEPDKGQTSARQFDGTAPNNIAPKTIEQVFRVGSFKADYSQAPRYVWGVLEGAPTGTDPGLIPNPNSHLWNFGGTLTPSELYIGIADRTQLCGLALQLWKNGPGDNSKLCDSKYLSGSRKRDTLARIASAFQNISVNAVEIPRFQGGIVAASPSFAKRLEFTWTVSGSFDPSLLVRGAADWATWETFSHGDQGGKLKGAADLEKGCYEDDVKTNNPVLRTFRPDCFSGFAAGNKWQRAILTALPKIDVKASTAFDYFKSGANTFFLPPNANRALYEFAGTWDLKKLLPSAQTRIQALTAYQQLLSKSTCDSSKPCGVRDDDWRRVVSMLYSELGVDSVRHSTDDSWWARFEDVVVHKKL